MEIVKNILKVLYIIVCIAIIVLATLQTKDSRGASGAITGSSTNNFYEKNKAHTKEGKMKRLTIFLGVVFVVLVLATSILYQV